MLFEENLPWNLFATTKQIKLNLKIRGILASERTVRRKLSKMNFKAHRHARKPKLTPAIVAKSLAWTKDHKDRDFDFWIDHSWRQTLILWYSAHFIILNGRIATVYYEDIVENYVHSLNCVNDFFPFTQWSTPKFEYHSYCSMY